MGEVVIVAVEEITRLAKAIGAPWFKPTDATNKIIEIACIQLERFNAAPQTADGLLAQRLNAVEAERDKARDDAAYHLKTAEIANVEKQMLREEREAAVIEAARNLELATQLTKENLELATQLTKKRDSLDGDAAKLKLEIEVINLIKADFDVEVIANKAGRALVIIREPKT